MTNWSLMKKRTKKGKLVKANLHLVFKKSISFCRQDIPFSGF